jgi:hypothetical protein
MLLPRLFILSESEADAAFVFSFTFEVMSRPLKVWKKDFPRALSTRAFPPLFSPIISRAFFGGALSPCTISICS